MKAKEQFRTVESRSEARWKVRSVVARTGLVIGMIVLVPTATQADSITARVTADEVFTIGVGSYSGLVAGPNYLDNGGVGFAPGHLNVQGGQQGLTFNNVDPNGLFYIVAASDNAGTAGILGEFQPNNNNNPGSLKFTSGPWAACATGVDWNPGAAPSLVTINSAIAACNAGTGASATTSVRWVGRYDQGGGVRADGEDNTDPGGLFGISNTISKDWKARWMWFNPTGGAFPDSGFTTPNDPFSPGPPALAAGKEFYIFRTPVLWILSKCFVTLSDEPKNSDPVNTATSVEYTITGCYSLIDTYNGPFVNGNSNKPVAGTTFGDPTVSCSGGYTHIKWSTFASIPPGGSAKVGVTLGTCNAPPYFVTMDPLGTPLCSHHVDVDSGSQLRGGVVKFSYPARGCETVPLFIRSISGEWYDDNNLPAAADINAATGQDPNRPHSGLIREPKSNGRGLDRGPYSITSGGTFTLPRALVQPPPRDASRALIIYNVTTNTGLDPNTDTTVYALLPLETPSRIPVLSQWGMISLVLLLFLAGWLVIRRQSARTPVS